MEDIRQTIDSVIAGRPIRVGVGLYRCSLACLAAFTVFRFVWALNLRVQVLRDIYEVVILGNTDIPNSNLTVNKLSMAVYLFSGWPSIALLLVGDVNLFSFTTLKRTILLPDLYYKQLLIDCKYHVIRPYGPIFCLIDTLLWLRWIYGLWSDEAIEVTYPEIVKEQSRALWRMIDNLNTHQLLDLATRLRERLADEYLPKDCSANYREKIVAIYQKINMPSSLKDVAMDFFGPPAQCVVCMERESEITLHPCCHTVLCEPCFHTMTEINDDSWQPAPTQVGTTCPACRTPILDSSYRRIHPRVYLTPSQYRYACDVTTSKELQKLYSYGHENPSVCKSKLVHCPLDAFNNRNQFYHQHQPTLPASKNQDTEYDDLWWTALGLVALGTAYMYATHYLGLVL